MPASFVWLLGEHSCPLPATPPTPLQGEITRIIPHRATGRADYFGPPVNRAARFLAASAPGQILAERSLVEECVQAWSVGDLVGCMWLGHA
jgi:hypothetical protein